MRSFFKLSQCYRDEKTNPVLNAWLSPSGKWWETSKGERSTYHKIHFQCISSLYFFFLTTFAWKQDLWLRKPFLSAFPPPPRPWYFNILLRWLGSKSCQRLHTFLIFQTDPLISLKQSTMVQCSTCISVCKTGAQMIISRWLCAVKRVVEPALLEERNFKELNSTQGYTTQQFLCLEDLEHKTIFASGSEEKLMLHSLRGNLRETRAVVSHADQKGFPPWDAAAQDGKTEMIYVSVVWAVTPVFNEGLIFIWIHRLNFGTGFLPSKKKHCSYYKKIVSFSSALFSWSQYRSIT